MEAPDPPLPPPEEEMLLPTYAEPEPETVKEQAACSDPELQGAAEGLPQKAQLGAQASEMSAIKHQVSMLPIQKHVQAHGSNTKDVIEVIKWKSPASCKQ